MTFALPATLVPATTPATTAARRRAAMVAARRPRRRVARALEPVCEDLDMPVTPLVDNPAGGRLAAQAAKLSPSALGGADCDGVAHPAHAFEVERETGAVGEVEVVALRVGAAIDDLGHQGVAVVGEFDRRAAGKRAVSDADRAPAQNLAAGRVVAVEPGAVPGGTGAAHRAAEFEARGSGRGPFGGDGTGPAGDGCGRY